MLDTLWAQAAELLERIDAAVEAGDDALAETLDAQHDEVCAQIVALTV